MAKKKEPELTYMQMPLPSGEKRYKNIRLDWKGLNRLNPYDTGYMSDEMNISTAEYPALTPSPAPISYTGNFDCNLGKYGEPISLFGFDKFLVYVAKHHIADDNYPYELRINYIDLETGVTYKDILIASASETDIDSTARQIIEFNAFVKEENSESVLNGEYKKKLLVFPDNLSFDRNVSGIADEDLYFDADAIEGGEYSPEPPDMDYVTVYLSRVFGVKGTEIYASGFNDYTNWKTDTTYEAGVDENGEITFTEGYDENNAWASAVQSNTASNGDFTGITTFQNHVIAFKRDYMYEIYNTKNPFRVKEIYAEGCINNKSIQDVGGTLIFASENGVFAYTGSKPKLLSSELKIDKFRDVIAGTDGRNYYMYCIHGSSGRNKELYVYDTYNGLWSQRTLPAETVIDFANTDYGLYALCNDGFIYLVQGDEYDNSYSGQSWHLETDFITTIASKTGTIDIKHIQKLQLYANIENGAELKVYILYDEEKFNADTSQLVFNSNGRAGYITARVIPRKTACYKFRLRIEGTGYAELRNLELVTSYGGDVNVSEEH